MGCDPNAILTKTATQGQHCFKKSSLSLLMNTFEDQESGHYSVSSSFKYLKYDEKDQASLSEDLFYVTVPLNEIEPDRAPSPRLQFKFESLAVPKLAGCKSQKKSKKISQFGRLKEWTQLPEPHNIYPGFNVRFISSWLNPVFVSFICLAVGTTLFSQLLTRSTNPNAETYSINEVQEMRSILLALKDHTMGGVNSTIWNLEKTANFTLNTMSKASQSLRLHSKDSEDSSQSLNNQKVVDSKASNPIDIPYEMALHNMSMALAEARKQLQFVNSYTVPAAYGSSKLNETAVDVYIGHVRRTARIWVILFSLLGVLSMFFAGILEVWNWKRQKQVDFTKDIYDLHEIGFKLDHGVISNLASHFARKIGELRGFDSSSLFRARLEWCFNFCFSEFMRKILSLSMILGVLSSACSFTLNHDKSELKVSANASYSANFAAFKQFQDHLNDKCYSLLANLLNNLGATYEQCASALSSQGGLDFGALSPFTSVAFEHLSLPDPASLTSKTSRSTKLPLTEMAFHNWRFLRHIIKILWAISVTLLSFWFLCGLFVCGYVMTRINIRESILYNIKMRQNSSI